MTMLSHYGALGGAPAVYVEDVFSTWLYTGNGSTQTITNGIDLLGKGGLVWTKTRNVANSNWFIDTVRGGTQLIRSNTTEGQFTSAGTSITFGSSSYTVGSGDLNTSTQTQVSWTFRKAPKFFDVVTYTGTGNTPNSVTVSHNLGSTPGFIVTKAISAVSDWTSWHRSASFMLQLNRTDAASSTINNFAGFIDNVTSTSFRVNAGSSANDINKSGVTYVAYIFAHDAGGFGATGNDNVISCGSFTATGSDVVVTLGYEPQWILIKRTGGARDWFLVDTMRGWTSPSSAADNSKVLNPNLSSAESDFYTVIPTSTGFIIPTSSALNNDAHIYIAIRRGPMKTPTSGTSVFSPNAQTTTAPTTVTTNFPVDLEWWRNSRTTAGRTNYSFDRLRGGTQELRLNTTDAEQTGSASFSNYFDSNTAFIENFSGAGQDAIFWSFRRAPGFFDVVCYTGNGVARNITHNLAAVPEMMIVKSRSGAGYSWCVYSAAIGNTLRLELNSTSASISSLAFWNSTTPTSSVFTVGTNNNVNANTTTYVAYLFATCPGVSKVGSYTGTGSTQVINCGFTGGARFVLIKATSTTGNWLVWDSARGIVAGNDPYLALNSTAAEVTNTDWVDTAATGFELSNNAGNLANSNGVSYIYLAIA